MPRKKNPYATPYVKPDYHSQNTEGKNDEDMDGVQKKKIKLRSSLDIYNRLIHDKTLNIELANVFIRYRDNVLGDQEICILDWRMIDKGGDIPMHHILYFILILNNGNKLMLWDRKRKLDRLYGSGFTVKKQKLNVILNSTKIKNIKSQKKKKSQFKKKTFEKHLETKTNENENDFKSNYNTHKIPKQIEQTDEMIIKYFPRYPATDDGFVGSFDINNTQKWLKYLDYYGLVVLKVLSQNEANQTINGMFDELYARTLTLNGTNSAQQQKIYKVDINNPYTWNAHNWPKPRSKFLTDRPAFAKQAFVNRCCSKMYFIFKTIYNDSKLNVSIDNWGIQRGTKDLTFVDPETGQKLLNGHNNEQKQWRKNLCAHWDINPWTYMHWLLCGHYKYIYQGALALSEQRLQDGTHLTLPGGMNYLAKWCELNKAKNQNPYRHNLDRNSHLLKYMQPIPLRKGEMVIWNYGQCHANTKNFSKRMRVSQYIRMFPAQQKYIKRDHYSAQTILRKYKRDIDIENILTDNDNEAVDELTLKLLGLKQW